MHKGLRVAGILFALLSAAGVVAIAVPSSLRSPQFVLSQFTNDGFREIERYSRRVDCESARLEILDAFKFPSGAERSFQCVQLRGRKQDALMVAIDKEAARMAFETGRGAAQ